MFANTIRSRWLSKAHAFEACLAFDMGPLRVEG
jgi:hypothetical protein